MTAELLDASEIGGSVLLDLADATELERLTARRSGIGSSDFGPIMGTNTRYNTPRGLWEDKTGRVGIDTETSEAAAMGQLFELPVAQAFAARFETQLFAVPYIMQSDENPVWLASPDYAIRVNGRIELVECKMRRSDWVDDQVPQDIVDQCQWQMSVTRTEKCHVAVVFGGTTLRNFGLVRDEQRIAQLREAAGGFWSHVLFDEPPAPLPADAARMTPTRNQLVVGGEVVELVTRRNTLASQAKTLKQETDAIDGELKVLLADHVEAVTEDGRIIATYKPSDRRSVSVDELTEAHPRIAKKMTRVTTSRRLDIKKVRAA